jgi:lipoprotein-anchoring transpeptidase ErfK/SrfK
MSRRRLLLSFIAVFLILNGLMWGLIGMEYAYAGKIPFGTRLHGYGLSGKTQNEALALMAPIHRGMVKRHVSFNLGDTTFTPTFADLGYTVDTTATINQLIDTRRKQTFFSRIYAQSTPTTGDILVYTIDNDVITKYLEGVLSEVNQDPQDIELTFDNGQITVVPAEPGVKTTVDDIRIAIQSSTAPHLKNTTVKVPYQLIEPAIAQESQVTEAKITLEKLTAQSLSLQSEGQTLELSPQDIFNFVVFTQTDNKITITFDETKIRDKVNELAKKVNITASVKKVSTVDNTTIVEGRDGRKLNVDDGVKKILERLKLADFTTPVAIAADKVNRPVTTDTGEYQLGRFEGKYIEIDLSLQRLNIIEGNTHVRRFAISSGKWSTPTPIGQFTIQNHIRTAWSNRYKLYMPFWMAIKKEEGSYEGYGLHGLPYWPNGAKEGVNHIGSPASHGCVRLGPGDDEFLYNWAENGTKVVIHE